MGKIFQSSQALLRTDSQVSIQRQPAPLPKRLVSPRNNEEPGPQCVMGTVLGAGDAVMNSSHSCPQVVRHPTHPALWTMMSAGRRKRPDPCRHSSYICALGPPISNQLLNMEEERSGGTQKRQHGGTDPGAKYRCISSEQKVISTNMKMTT